jgi:Holliday junction resolvasome RuvABC DNA-binding subunit
VAANIGPLFGLLASAPAEWNVQAVVSAHQRVLKASNGQAYMVDVPSKALREALDQGAERWVFLAQVLREDGESLFAFENVLERALFVELRELDSIGSKFAAAAVSELGPLKLLAMAEGKSVITGKVPGLGPKTLEKLKTGLKDRKEKFQVLLASKRRLGGENSANEDLSLNLGEVPSLILQALGKVGVRPQDAERVYKQLSQEHADFSALPTGEQLKMILARWGQSKNRMTTLEGPAS